MRKVDLSDYNKCSLIIPMASLRKTFVKMEIENTAQKMYMPFVQDVKLLLLYKKHLTYVRRCDILKITTGEIDWFGGESNGLSFLSHGCGYMYEHNTDISEGSFTMLNMKKFLACAVAAMTMAAGMSSLSASAVLVEPEDWYARDINTPGAPSSVDTVDTVILTASAYTYVGVCTDMTVTSNRKTTIWCSTHQMQDNKQDVWSFEINTPDCPVDWTIVNKDKTVTYRVSCTTNSASVLESWGTISVYS